MSNPQKIEEVIEDHINLLVVDAKSLAQAQDRSAKFLTACSLVASYLMELEKAMTKAKTIMEIQHSQAIGVAEGGTITERKLNAPKCVAFSDARETMERCEAKRSWLKTHIKIFENAHTLFRQLSNR